MFDETEAKATIKNPDTNSVLSTNTLNRPSFFSSATLRINNGEKVDLLEIQYVTTHPNKFLLNAMDQLFIEEKDLIGLDPKFINEDAKIKCTRGKIYFLFIEAVQVKFGFTKEQLATVWTPMLDYIKPKIRNLKANIQKSELATFTYPLK